MYNMLGKGCNGCNAGYFKEMSLNDDWEGMVTCSCCDLRVKRWATEYTIKKPLGELITFVQEALSLHIKQLLDNHDFWDDDVAEGILTEEDVERIRGFTATITLST